jgi:CheY-like chemotaxis protein
MPVMDGWSVLTELKKRPETSDIPVIMLSMMDELDMSFALGAADYLMKPIQKDVLVKTVLRHLRDNENGRVLVVDDQEENRRLIVQVLHRHGIGTYEAENGIEAIKVMEKHIPNLILLDLMMPEMDGFRFSEEVKKRDDWKDVPIVVLTARDLSDEDLKRLSGNVEKVFERKTLNLEDFLIEIQSVVTRTVRSINNKE